MVEVVRRRGPRPVEPPSTPLPASVLAALEAIVRDMRDVPRDCIRDPAELVIWLRRMAGRVEGVGRMRVVISSGRIPAGKVSDGRKVGPISSAQKVGGLALPAPSNPSPHDLAEAVFGKAPTSGKSPQVGSRPATRTITSRKGRAVTVEMRRARQQGQMELW